MTVTSSWRTKVTSRVKKRNLYVVAWYDCGITGWASADTIAKGNMIFKSFKKRMEKARRWICKVPVGLKGEELEQYVDDEYHECMFEKWEAQIARDNGN